MKICRIPECKNERAKKCSLCNHHKYNWYIYKSYERPRRILSKDIIKFCKVNNCNKKTRTYSSLCSMHQNRWRRFKSYEIPKKKIYPDGIVKECASHGYLTIDEIYKHNKYLACKKCRQKNQKILKEKTKNDYKKPDNFKNLARNYGLNKKKYMELLINQNYVCAICKKEETAKSTNKDKNNNIKRLSVDHCHQTGKIRGLLCTRCNTGIGVFKDSIELLENAIRYINKNLS